MLRALLLLFATTLAAADPQWQRVEQDAKKGTPLVLHVTVALCDNASQGIVPVPSFLGNGDDLRQNLYWGASLGVRSYFASHGWKRVEQRSNKAGAILERIVFRREVAIGGRSTTIWAVADAWRGREIRSAIAEFMQHAAGEHAVDVVVEEKGKSLTLHAGGASHLVAYVGHDGLMEFDVAEPQPRTARRPAAVVLACVSRHYFGAYLQRIGTPMLVMTSGLMAPEAYTLDAVARSWFSNGSVTEAREAAAVAYDRHQKCGLRAARRLFEARH